MVKKIRKAVIPAAGYGTRLLPITKAVHKELLPIGTKPVIQFVVEEAAAAGIEEIILVCNRSKFSIADYFRPDEGLNRFLSERGKTKELEELRRIESLARLSTAYQDQPLGLGHAILCAKQAVGDEPFLVMLPDVLIADGGSVSVRLIEEEKKNGGWGVALERVSPERAGLYGIIRGKEEDGIYRIDGAVEKPKKNESPSDLAMLGRYLFPSEIFELLEKQRPGVLGEIQLTDAIDALAKTKPGYGIVCKSEIFDVGTSEGFKKASVYFAGENS
jgi:UTP--glucose-1-phosphate uridylyltransferase